MIVFQSLLLAAHLLTMNIAASGPLACVVLQFLKGRENAGLRKLSRQLAILSLACFFVGAILGLAMALSMWQGGEARYFQALQRLPSKLYFGVWELAFYVLCMGIYVAWFVLRPPSSMFARLCHGVVGLAAATNLLWHFPALMTVISHLAVTAPAGDAIDAAGFRELIFGQLIMSRWVHIWLASFATTAIALAWYANTKSRSGDDAPTDEQPNDCARVVVWSGRVALAATLLQLPTGMWVLMSATQTAQARLMGGDIVATALLVLSIIAALMLMHQLASISLGNASRSNVVFSVGLLMLVTLLMSATLLKRRGDGMRQPVEQNVQAQPSSAIMLQ